jgi:type IV pilus biogenesis protein CpaD/CtpE
MARVTGHPGQGYNRCVGFDDSALAASSGCDVARIVLRNEWGALLSAAMPECDITVASGSTHLSATVRDQAELFGILERLRNLGAEIASLTLDQGRPNSGVDTRQ